MADKESEYEDDPGYYHDEYLQKKGQRRHLPLGSSQGFCSRRVLWQPTDARKLLHSARLYGQGTCCSVSYRGLNCSKELLN